MLLHSMLPRSAVNGPGDRVVVWLQGCDLRCPGCWNPFSHGFDRSRDKPVDEVGEWILSCQGVEGVTFSGGEPFQQAADLRFLCEYIKLRRPGLSIGVFSGYTVHELVQGQWHWRSSRSDAWVKGDFTLFAQIRQFLDFGVFGRFRQTMACSDKPLCGSRNQEIVFLSDRYSPRDLQPQSYEVNIGGDGVVTITGFPPADLWG
jgi:anaerobic ribonucleoside-triphosphate reductase activating protein